jgi:glycosyltransferase involved in cell wall biosynthesis
MKICFLLEYYYPHIGGAEILFQHLAEGLVLAGHSCEVVTSRLPGTPLEETINGVRIHRIAVPRFGDRYWFTLASLHAAWKFVRNADIVHTMVYNGALPAKILSKALRKPLVIHVFEVIRNNWFQIGINPFSAVLYRIIEKIVLSLDYDAYSCISRNTLSLLVRWGINPDKLFLAYPGIDYSLFDPERYLGQRQALRIRLGVSSDHFIYSYFGRPGFVKGIDHLVRAASLVRDRFSGAKLMLILSRKPASGYRRVLRALRKEDLVIGRDVILIDPVPRQQLPSYILASDCVVVPSISEGFGFTCVEACAMNRPVVATTAGSLPEVVSGRHVLVPPADPAALAAGIEQVRNGVYAHKSEIRFTWEEHVSRHIEAYKRLLACPSNTGKLTIHRE